MQKIIQGVVHGKTIELNEDLGLSEGQEVAIVVKPLPQTPRAPGEAWKRLAGLLADEWTEEDDRILEEIYQSRKEDNRREMPE
jgi:hypothetical protein